MSVIALLLCQGCARKDASGIPSIFATPIEQLLASPERYEDRNVLIVGQVIRSGGIGRKSAYMVDDGSASIWVLDHSSAPAVGAEVRIRGRPQQWVRMGNKTITVFRVNNEE